MHLTQALDAFAQDVPSLIATSIVSLDDGTCLSTFTVPREQQPDTAAADAYLTEVLKKNALALDAIGLQTATEDILITTPSASFIARVLGDSNCFWHVITEPSSSLGLTRAFMRKYEATILNALP